MTTKTAFLILAIVATIGIVGISFSSQTVFAESGQRTFTLNDGNLHLKCVTNECINQSTHTDNGQHTGQP